MYILHPDSESLINTAQYADIRMCNVNTTHVDFYIKAPKKKRGKPDLTLVFESVEERQKWFLQLVKKLAQ